MRKITKGLLSLLVTGALTFAPAAAFAATDNTTAVTNSGDNVTVNSNSSQTSSVTVNNTNSADVSQVIHASANTGGNSNSGNIGGASSITTGSAGVAASLGVTANRNTTAISGVDPSSSNVTDVVNTGDNLHVNTGVSTGSSVNVNNSNSAAVEQMLFAHTDTGHNSANDNIGLGGASVSTGNAGVAASFSTDLNRNETAVMAGANTANTVANATLVTNTGDHVYVNTVNHDSSNVNVNNSNSAAIGQMFFGSSDSGWNGANDNIGGASVMSGNAGVLANFAANANSNLTGVGSMADPMSINFADVVNTGDHLHLNDGVNTQTNLAVNNTDSLATHQMSFQHSNTGYNYSSSNVGVTHVIGGSAGVAEGFSATGNSNTTILGNILSLLSGLMNFI